MDDASYKPAPQVLDAIKHVRLVGVVGPTGAGKTTLMEAAIARDPQLHLVLSDTNRPPRAEEQDGVDYHFRSRPEILARMQRAAYVQMPPNYTGHLYATAPESYTADGISIMAIIADAIPAFRALPFKTMRIIFITPPDFKTWQARLHGERNALDKRLAEACRSFAFALQDEHTTFIINDNLTTATTELLHLAHGRSPTPKLQADQSCGRALVANLLMRIAE